jgi:hypothetical protein
MRECLDPATSEEVAAGVIVTAVMYPESSDCPAWISAASLSLTENRLRTAEKAKYIKVLKYISLLKRAQK